MIAQNEQINGKFIVYKNTSLKPAGCQLFEFISKKSLNSMDMTNIKQKKLHKIIKNAVIIIGSSTRE